MAEFAKSEFELNARQVDGQPLRVHLQKQANGFVPNGDALDRLLNAPDCPQEAAHLWADFQSLDARREWFEAGPRAISWEAINSWRTVRRIELEPWEVQALDLLDKLFLQTYFESKDK